MTNLGINLEEFVEKFIQVVEKNESDEEIYQEFSKLTKEECFKTMELIIDQLEDIKTINNLIRLQESLKTIFDYKILFLSIKAAIIKI